MGGIGAPRRKKIPECRLFGGAFSGLTGILPVSRFGDGNENGESACSCSLIHSKFIRHGRCLWDGWWELAVVLQCRHFLHKPKAEFENTTARAQKASTHKSTHESTHESTESRKAGKAQEREHESTRAREHESTRAREQRNTSEPKASETLCALITAAQRHYPESRPCPHARTHARTHAHARARMHARTHVQAHLDVRHWTVNHRTCFGEVDSARHNSVEQCHGAFKRRARAWLSSTALG